MTHTAHTRSRFGTAAGALGLACFLFSACRKPPPPAFERPPAPVVVAAALQQDVPVYLDEVGKCAAREVVSVRPQVSGRITEIHFADGADLAAGDALFTIDPRPFEAALENMQSRLAQAEAVLGLAGKEVARLESVKDPRAITEQDVDVKKSAVEVAEALARQARAAVETAKLDLEYTSIRAPIAGRAGERLVHVGNVVTANEGTLVVIQSLDPIYVDFTVAENDLTTVQQEMARGPLRVEVRLPDEDRERGEPRTGALTFLDNTVGEATGTVKLRATLPNADHGLWPGRFVEIRLVLSTLAGAVLVPASAPQSSAQGTFVYVVKEDSKAEMRPVKTGQRQGGLVVISEGIEAGERVVVEGQLGVMPGGPVRPVEAGAPAHEPGAASPKPASH